MRERGSGQQDNIRAVQRNGNVGCNQFGPADNDKSAMNAMEFSAPGAGIPCRDPYRDIRIGTHHGSQGMGNMTAAANADPNVART